MLVVVWRRLIYVQVYIHVIWCVWHVAVLCVCIVKGYQHVLWVLVLRDNIRAYGHPDCDEKHGGVPHPVGEYQPVVGGLETLETVLDA